MIELMGEELTSRMRLPAARLRSEWRGHLDWVSASVTPLESLCTKTLREVNNEEPMVALRRAREMELLCVSIISAIQWCGERYGHDESFEAALGEARSAEQRCSACASTSSVALFLSEHRSARCALRDAEDAYEHRESLDEWLDPDTHPSTQLRSWRRGDFSSALRLIYGYADLAALASDDHRAGVVVAADIATRGIVSESEARAATAIWLSDFADGMRCAGNDDAAESATISCAWMASRAGFDENVAARLAVSRRLARVARYAPDAVLVSLAALEDASDDRFRAARRNAWLQLDNPRQALAAVRASPDPALRHPIFKHLVDSNRRELAVCLAATDPDEISLAHFCDDRTAAAFLLSRRRYADLLRLFRGPKHRDKLAEIAVRMAANAHPPVSWSPPPSTFAQHYVADLKKQHLPHVDLRELSRKNKIARRIAEKAAKDIKVDSASQPVIVDTILEEEDDAIYMEEEHNASTTAGDDHLMIEKDDDEDTDMQDNQTAHVQDEAEENVVYESGVAARWAGEGHMRNFHDFNACHDVDDHHYGGSDYPLPSNHDDAVDAAEDEHEQPGEEEEESSHLADNDHKEKPTRNKDDVAHHDDEEAGEQGEIEEYSEEVLEEEHADEENEDVEEGVKLLGEIGQRFAFYSDDGEDHDEELVETGIDEPRDGAVEGEETEDEEILVEQVGQAGMKINLRDQTRDLAAGGGAQLDVELVHETAIAPQGQNIAANQEDGDAGRMIDEARREENVAAIGAMDIDQNYRDERYGEDVVMVDVANIVSREEAGGRIRIEKPLSSYDISGRGLDALDAAAEDEDGNVMCAETSNTPSDEAKEKALLIDVACREHVAAASGTTREADATEDVREPYDVDEGRRSVHETMHLNDPLETRDGRAGSLGPTNQAYEVMRTANIASDVAADYRAQFRARFADEYAVSAAIAVAELASLPAHNSHLVDEGVDLEDTMKLSTTPESGDAEAERRHGKVDKIAIANEAMQQVKIEQEHATGYASALDLAGAEPKQTNKDNWMPELYKRSHSTVESQPGNTAAQREAEIARQSTEMAERGEYLRVQQQHVATVTDRSWGDRMEAEAVRADDGERIEVKDQQDYTKSLMGRNVDAANRPANSGPVDIENNVREHDATMEHGINSAKALTIEAYESEKDKEERGGDGFLHRRVVGIEDMAMQQEEQVFGSRVSAVQDADPISPENNADRRCSFDFAPNSTGSHDNHDRDVDNDESGVDQDDEEEDSDEEEDGDEDEESDQEEDFRDDVQSDSEDNDGPPEASGSMGASAARDYNTDNENTEDSRHSSKSHGNDTALLPTSSQQSLSGIPEDTDIALQAESRASGKPAVRGRARSRRLSIASNASTKSRSSTTSLTDIDVSNIIHTSRRRNVTYAPRGSRYSP